MRIYKNSIPVKFSLLVLIFVFSALLVGCAPTHVEIARQPNNLVQLPRPNKILVYNFAFTANAVKLNQGLGAKVENYFTKTPKTQQELEAAERVANSLSTRLVEELNAVGLPASKAESWQIPQGNVLVITGNFIDIDQGNRLRRMVIGFGIGGTEVFTQTQIIDYGVYPKNLLFTFNTHAKSSTKPGIAPFIGVGAAAGHVVTSTAVSGTLASLSEVLGASTEEDAKRTAKEIVKKLIPFFVQQGWIKSR